MAKTIGTQALVAIYPLQQTDYEGVERALTELRKHGLEIRVEGTHTTLVGSADKLFEALRQAFEEASQTGPTTMTVTVTNACALPTWAGQGGRALVRLGPGESRK